jgi:NADP-dependent 3-hydroxy acid dehydrogenase YdfG
MIAITGHTSGIGRAIATWFATRDHHIRGFAGSTGYDLAQPDTIDRIVTSSLEVDVFINNAYHAMAQVDLLYALYHLWANDTSKTILTISSNSGDGTKNYPHPYAVYKNALDKAIEQLQNTRPACRIMNLRPGYVDTARVSHVQARKLAPSYVAEIVGWMVQQPVLIKTLTVEA